jgi:hypothetical protein
VVGLLEASRVAQHLPADQRGAIIALLVQTRLALPWVSSAFEHVGPAPPPAPQGHGWVCARCRQLGRRAR